MAPVDLDPTRWPFARCPIELVCGGSDQAWAGWLFLAWMVVMLILGIAGICREWLQRRRR